MKRKFFFFDIDGTLAVGTPGNQYVPESTKIAISKLKEAGHFVAIATGRSYAMAVEHMKELGFENMVSDGGNGITIHNKLVEIKPLDYDKCINLINECKEKGYIWAISPDNATRRLAPDNRFYDFTHVPGSYHDIAAHKFFPGEEIELICCSTFEEVFANIKQDSNVIGMLAIENTIAGSLLHNYELLRESGMTIACPLQIISAADPIHIQYLSGKINARYIT